MLLGARRDALYDQIEDEPATTIIPPRTCDSSRVFNLIFLAI